MTEENKKPWQVTLPYDDVRAMEAQAEVLCDIQTEMIELKSYLAPYSHLVKKLDKILEKIRKAQQT